MNFDLTKVYSAETAEELKEGDKVLVADSLAVLKDMVEGDCTVETIDEILDQPYFRFKIKRGNYAFAYLIEEAKEEKWRPFKNIDELTDAWIRITGIPQVANTMPLIWLRGQNTGYIRHIEVFNQDSAAPAVYIGGVWHTMLELLICHTFLDGSPCGVKE